MFLDWFRTYGFLNFVFISTVTADVDIWMTRLVPRYDHQGYEPAHQACQNIGPGRCCNNILQYQTVSFSGLTPHDIAATFKRRYDGWSTFSDWRDWRLAHSAIKTYGCQGIVLDAALPRGDGNRIFTYYDINQYATGAMWWDCTDDPLRELRDSFKPPVYDRLRTALQSTIRAMIQTCRIPIRRTTDRLDTPRDGVSSQDENTNVTRNVVDGIDNSTSSNIGQDDVGCVFPNLIIYNGTNYTDSTPGSLNFYDSQGSLLDLAAIIAPEES